MPVSSSTEHWIKPDALTIKLNHFGDPDYLQVSVLAGAVVMAFKQDVIGYNAAHNYRTWPLEAANTYLETSSAVNVYAKLTRSEVNARAIIAYDTVLRDIEGREITYAEDGSEILGEPNPDLYYVFLGQISGSVDNNGQSVQREWLTDFRFGILDTTESINEDIFSWQKLFIPHYEDPIDPTKLSWIEVKSHMGIQGGATMFINGKGMNLPSIYDGLPIDGQTIYWEEDEDGNKVCIKAKIGGGTLGSLTNVGEWADSVADVDRIMVQKKGSDTWKAMDMSEIGSASFENIFEGGDGNAYTSFVLSGDKKSITLMKGMKFATTDDLDKRINNLINGAPAAYDTLKEIADVLQGNVNSIGDIITTLGTKWTQDDTKIANWDAAYSWGNHANAGYAAKSYVDSTFVPIKGDCNIEGIKNFIGSLQVNGSPIVYDKEKGYWYFTGDMIVSGGITMFGNPQGFEPSTIMDGVHVDGVTIIKENGRLVALGGGGSGGSELDTVAWGNILGKPSWITDDKPECVNPFSLSWNGRETGSYNGSMGKSFYIPSKLSELTDDVVSGKYLPLTGGVVTGRLGFSDTTYPQIYGNGAHLTLGIKKTSSNYLVVTDTTVQPNASTTGMYLGSPHTHWSNIYSVLGNFSGQITSTVADGTAPFIVTSKTEVANLHSATATKLHTPITLWGNPFDGSSDINGYFIMQNNRSLIWKGTDESNVNCMLLQDNNNLFIGAGVRDKGTRTVIGGGSIEFTTTKGTAAMHITTSGNVGIGTTSPQYKLHVNGNIAVSNGIYTITNKDTYTDADGISRPTYGMIFSPDNTVHGRKWSISNFYGMTFHSGLPDRNFIWASGSGDSYKEVATLTGSGSLSLSSTLNVGGTSSFGGITTHNSGLSVSGININKSQDGVLYIDGNLVVRGGITMYGTDTTSTPSIFDSLPIASTSAKGIAQFSGDYFTVSDGVVRIIDGSVGLKESELNAILDGKNYATKTDLSGYLKLSGGTLTGTSLSLLSLNSSDTRGNVIYFKQDGVTKGVVGWYDDMALIGSQVHPYGQIGVKADGSPVYRKNVTEYYKLWHEGNDGDGSGLDADTLDGNHASRFIGLYTRSDIGSAPNYDNPSVNGLFELRPESGLPDATGERPINGNAPFFSIKSQNVMMQISGESVYEKGWWIRGRQSANVTLEGVAWQRLVIEDAQLREWDIKVKSATKLKTAVSLWGNTFDGSSSVTGQLVATKGIHINTSTDSYPLLISRNGDLNRERTSIYQNDLGLVFDVLNEEKTSHVYFNFSAIDTENSDGTDAKSGTLHFGINGASKIYVKADEFQGIASSATKLQTPRTIWGRPFDGTGDVSGALTGVGNITAASSIAIISSNNGNIALRYNNDAINSVVLSNGVLRPYDEANGLIDLGSTVSRWKNIFGQSLDVTGSIISGNIYSSGVINTGGKTNQNDDKYGTIVGLGVLELYSITPFIDFHYNKYTKDYTSRIIEGLEGQLTVTGKLRVGLDYTTSTDYKFHVVGTTYSSGNITSGGSITASNNFSGQNITLSDSVTINGIKINKSQDGTLYLDGNLVVKGGITMYGTDATNTPSILDSLPKASYGTDDVNKGIASFDGSYFRVTDGYVSLIADSVGLNEDRLGEYLVEKGYLTTSNYNSYAPTLTGGGASGNWNININGGIIPKAIASGDDLNNYLTSGRYHAFAAIVSKSLLNNPISSQDNGVILDVIKETSSALQILYGTALGGLFTRRYANGGWSDWVEYLKVSDLLNKIKSVDGANSGLDADMLDGLHSTSLMKFEDYTDYVRASFVSDTLAERASSKYIEFWYNNKWFNIQAGKIKAHSGFEGSLTGNADTATALSDLSSYTIFGKTFFVNGKPQSISSLSNGSWLKINNTGGTEMRLVGFNSSNQAFFGFDSRENNYDTYIDGGALHLRSKSGYIDITSSGNVGVNKAPSYNFDVSGIIHATSDIMADGDMSADYMYANRFSINTSNYITTSGGYLSLNTASNELSISGTSNSNIHVNYRTAANGYAPSKWIWLAGSSGSYAAFSIGDLTVNGNILSTGGITMYSQRSLKNVVDERGLTLNELSAIKPTRYTWKDGRDSNIHIGGIADDIKQVLPEVVYKTSEGVLTMDYGNAGFAIAASLIKPVVDHEEKIRQLQKRVSELEQELNRIRA